MIRIVNNMMLCLGYTLVVNMVPCVNVGVVSLLILQMEEYEDNNRERVGHVEILAILLFFLFQFEKKLKRSGGASSSAHVDPILNPTFFKKFTSKMLKFVSRDGVELPPALKEMSKAFETLNADSTSSDSSVRTPTSMGQEKSVGKKRLNKDLHIQYDREEEEAVDDENASE